MPRDKQTLLNPPLYNEDAIQPLEGLEAVRKRPGMYLGALDTEQSALAALQHGLDLLITLSQPPQTIMITRVHAHQLSMSVAYTRAYSERIIASLLERVHSLSHLSPGIFNAFCSALTLTISDPDETRLWCYEQGARTMRLSGVGVDGAPSVRVDATLDDDLLPRGVSWAGLQRLTWREAVIAPNLRFILSDAESGEQVTIHAPDGPATWLAARWDGPTLSIARTTSETHLRVAIARVPQERGHIELWSDRGLEATRSGPLLDAIRSFTGPDAAILITWREGQRHITRWASADRSRLLNTASIKPLLASLKAALPQWRLHH
jgi:hypothetical protein